MNRRRFLTQAALSLQAVALAGATERQLTQAPLPQPKQPPPPKPELVAKPRLIPPKPWSLPGDAVRAAHADAASLQKAGVPLAFARWIWIPSAEKEDWQAVCDTLVKITRTAAADTRPVLVGGILARVSLTDYYPRLTDLQEILEQWEELRFDPWLSYIVVAQVLATFPQFRQARCRRWTCEWIDDGKGGWKWQRKFSEQTLGDVKNLTVERLNNGDAERAGYSKLQAACLTEAPIVSADYFVARTLDTIKRSPEAKKGDAKKVWEVVYGGLYYEFRGIRKVDKKLLGDKATDFDQLFFDLGIGAKGENFKRLFARLGGGDQAAVLYRRRVNGKKCRIRWFSTPTTRPTDSQSVVFVTEDLLDDDIGLDKDPIANLVDVEPAAYEVIFTGANGQLGYALYNGAGARLDEAAPDIASDRLVPNPHTTRLRSAISCIRCHGTEGSGWQEFENDLPKILAGRFAGYGDLTNLNEATAETLGRLRGQYSASNDRIAFLLNDLRKHYARNVLAATDTWDRSAEGKQLDVVDLSSARISKMFAREMYDPATPQSALRRLGAVLVDTRKEAVTALRELVTRETAPRVAGIVREDPRLLGLLSDVDENAFDFALAYSFALDRAQIARRQQR